MDYISTPSVCVDMDVTKRNIDRTVHALAEHGITHRPHIKTHKSLRLAQMQLNAGCKGITCAKLGEAEVMANGGIDDIFIAYPLIGQEKWNRYGRLMERGLKMLTLVNSTVGARGLSALGQRLGTELPVVIEMDGGLERGGLRQDNLYDFVKEVAKLPGIILQGVCCYSGGIYGCKTMEEIRNLATQEREELLTAADCLRKLGLQVNVISGGSSFSVLCPDELHGLTEVRAGNYIFNDNALLSIGKVDITDCSLKIRSTVVARPSSKTAIIDAGSKTLTTDNINYREGYGLIVDSADAIIYKLNEEHGYVKRESGLDWEVGHEIDIIPNHACTVTNLCDELLEMENGKVVGSIRVEARGMNR